MIIENVKVFHKGKIVNKDIRIKNQKIEGLINTTVKGERRIDGDGLLVLPGMIDPHVHLRDPGATHKEDFHTGTRAAIAGGFTTVLDMPNNPKPTITKKRLDEKIKLAKKKAICDVGFHFGTTDDNFKEIEKTKPDSLKIIMGQTTGSLLIRDGEVIEKHFRKFPKNKIIVLHAEDQEYIEKTGDGGPKSAWRAVDKAVELARRTDRKIHIAHAGTKKEVEIVKGWKKATVEVAPHYLFLSKKDFGKLEFKRFVKPPLREESERMKLWGVLDKIDCIATDHAPHLIEEKKEGAYGFPGLETSLHLFLNSYIEGLVSLKWIVERMSENPAKIFGIKGKGKIQKGYFADLVFVDLKKEWVVKGDRLETKCKWSPFEGKKLKGKVVGVMNKGKIKYWDGKFQ